MQLRKVHFGFASTLGLVVYDLLLFLKFVDQNVLAASETFLLVLLEKERKKIYMGKGQISNYLQCSLFTEICRFISNP